ncbi:MAG: MOSC domain-containing protein [Chloroflexi bacterium]|nr:MOSC domain-containing protein [Chloroflexota bacterium]
MQTSASLAGSVVSLWRYPVKSMQGEQIDTTAITERGILGDRAYAILDRETGHVASAKHPRKWSKLIACRAAFVEPPQLGAPLPAIAITLPDGQVVSSAQPDIDRILSRLFEREVSLVTTLAASPTREADRTPIDGTPEQELIRAEPMAIASPSGTFFDYAPVHLLTTATIARLQALFPAGRFDVRRFRPNIVVAPAAQVEGFVENDWLGRAIVIGAEAAPRLDLIDPSPRCVVTTLAQEDLPRDPGILRTIAQHNAAASVTAAPGVVFPAVAGVYAAVRRDGTIRQHDPIFLSEQGA